MVVEWIFVTSGTQLLVLHTQNKNIKLCELKSLHDQTPVAASHSCHGAYIKIMNTHGSKTV